MTRAAGLRFPTAALLALALVACGDAGSPDADGSTGADTTDTGASDPTDPTNPTDPTAPADTGNDSTSGGDDTGQSTGEPVDPADLPFGGYVAWTMQDLFAFADAEFYTFENPDELYEDLRPVEPFTTETFYFATDDTGEDTMGPPEPVTTPLDPGPQVFVSSDSVDLTLEYSPDGGYWTADLVDLEEIFPGGSFSVDIPGKDPLPPGTFGGLVSPPGDAATFTVVKDDAGVPTQVTWTPQTGAHHVTLFAGAVGPNGSFAYFCAASLLDDGSVDLPAGCIDGAGIDGWDPSAYDTFILVLGHSFIQDVAWGEYRLQLSYDINTQLETPFPFAPEMQ